MLRLSKLQTMVLFSGILLSLHAMVRYLAKGSNGYIYSFYATLSSTVTVFPPSLAAEWLITIFNAVLSIGICLLGVWIVLTCAQKANIPLLIWNAPQEKTLLHACLIPGICCGIIVGLIVSSVAYVNGIFLWPYMASFDKNVSYVFAFWHYANAFFIEFIRLFLISLGILIINYIKPLRYTLAAHISNIFAALFFILPILKLASHEYLVPTVLSAIMPHHVAGIIFGWIMFTYSFEGALVAHLVCTGIIISISFLL